MPARLVLIPGMGADHRVFDGIRLPGLDAIRADWIPHRAGESLATYAGRFGVHYCIEAADILIGMSMGGIVAGVLAQRVPPQRLILISSCTDIRQLSPFVTALSPLGPYVPFGLARLLPRAVMPVPRKRALEMFGAQEMGFIRWACGALMEWTGAPRLPGTVTIHGTADRVFPIRLQPQVDVTIQGGGHLMVLERAAEVGEALRRALR
jgi:pimeloyl-ACP methyl ester carboxylesterase